ncbi:hypothetical protein DPSP01_004043 [Paraphaeosphaeria sporulosa]
MKHYPKPGFRYLLIVSLILGIWFIVLFHEHEYVPLIIRDGFATQRRLPFEDPNKGGGQPVTERLDLSETECRASFPELFKEIKYAANSGKVMLTKDDGDYQGLVQGWIKDNRLYILTTAPDKTSQILHQRTAILSQLHRALLTSPARLPNTPFAFVVNDSPRNHSWAFSRPNKQSDYNLFVMPSFAFWSWPSPTLGAFDATVSRIVSLEETTPFDRKIDKVAWRGTPWFNPLGHPTLRQDLLKATRHREWADVAALNTSTDNALAIEDFCRYKYVMYTEGVTYSGRLPYHQACESVLITSPLTYLTHTAWLMKPIVAEDLIAAFANGGGEGHSNGRHEAPLPLLQTVRDWRAANAIYVSSKFEDLEEVIMLLRAHPEVAQRIARNQRETVVERGYLSAAAEVCYWRALIKTWAVSVVKGDEWEKDIGERYETWLLKQVASTSERSRRKSAG